MIVRPPRLPEDLLNLVDIRNGALALTEGGVPPELWTVESLAHYLSYPMIEPQEDLLVLESGRSCEEAEKAPGGFALLARSQLAAAGGGPVAELWELWVNPYLEVATKGQVLLRAARAVAARRGAAVLRTTWVPVTWGWLRALLAEEGFRPVRRFITLRRAPGREAPAAPPDGAWTPLDRADDDQAAALAALYNESFARNWGVEPHSVETLRFQVRAAPAEGGGAGYGLVNAAERPVGFLMSYLNPATDAWTIDALGVTEAMRGRGLGRWLLAQAIHCAAAAGAGEVQISVDAANEGALGLYRSMGFTPHAHHDVFELALV